MVLLNSTAQYKFLQVLVQSYVYMYGNLQSAGCMVSPQIFTDCTDYNANGYLRNSIPYLPTTDDLYSQNDPAQFSYSDYSTVNWYGFNTKNFPTVNVTSAAIAVLSAACGANSTCSTAFSKTTNASLVISSLVKTNVNSIAFVLRSNPSLAYFPPHYYGQLSNLYQATPSPNSETYGLHNGPVFGMAQGRVNASAYMAQSNLARMVSGGFQAYESLLHTAILGSWSVNDNLQSNINITGTQVFTSLSRGSGLDSRALELEAQSNRLFESKWEVWREEAYRASKLPDREEIFAEIKRRITTAQPYYNVSAHLMDKSPVTQICVPPNTQQGIDWLNAVKTTICSTAGALSDVKSLTGPLSTGLDAAARGLLTPQQYNAVNHEFAMIITSQVAAMCGSGNAGFPCYPGTAAWQIASGAKTVIGVAAEVAEYSNPAGEVLLAANLFCGLSDIAAGFYKLSRGCCASDCTSPSCQSSYGGCTQGTGIC